MLWVVALLVGTGLAATLTWTNRSGGAPGGEGLAQAASPRQPAPAWVAALRGEVERIDAATPGTLGIYVKRLADGGELIHPAGASGTRWYLASSAKLPVAIAVMREVEAGRLALDQPLMLRDSHKIDGAGSLMWQDTGSTYPVEQLLRRMLMESDNTASNLLIHTLGEDTLGRHVRDLLGAQVTLTDFVEVRRRVYAELHPAAAELSNVDLVKIAGSPIGPERVNALRRTLEVDASELRVRTIDEAYARYYATRVNEAPLPAYGRMLERLARGELLSPENTQRLFKLLKFDTYDAYRLEAGLPHEERFIHKTGTQFQRACHMGVVNPQDGGADALVVATCAQGLDEHKEAGRAFEQLGEAITRTVIRPTRQQPGGKPDAAAAPPAVTAPS